MKARTLACLIAFTVQLCAVEPTPEQQAEWERLYPKLNSKMARMEELVNYLERFLGSRDFTDEMLSRVIELHFLTEASLDNLPVELPAAEHTAYKKALTSTKYLVQKLYIAIENGEDQTATDLLKKLHTLRRKSHAKWGT